MPPKVTIGVCVKDVESCINEAIDSILAQDYPHELMEVIFVDDGSTDSTLCILENYLPKMNNYTKLFHQEWKGLGPARNKIVESATCNYIIWVDADMILPTDHVRKQVDFMEKNPKVGIGKARYELVTEKNVVAFLENIPFVVDTFKTNLSYSRIPGTGGSIFNVNAIRQVGGFDNALKGVGEDQDIAYRIMSAGWEIKLTGASFFEQREKSWSSLWQKYIWYGYGNYELYQKNRKIFKLYKMIPLFAFFAGLFYSFYSYQLTRSKTVFLLPLQFVFKSVAWCCGFLKAAFVIAFR